LSLGGAFEFYDLFQTAYLSPGLIANGIFRAGAKGLFGLTDQATFAAATFAGLFIGTIVFGSVADRFGRRAVFTFSLLWYTAASVAMGLQRTNIGVDVWRLIAGVGIGVELVTIDAYVSELAPARLRGRAFGINQFVQFLAIPVLALICWILVPRTIFGLAGWRWLAQQERLEEASAAIAQIEQRVEKETGHPLTEPMHVVSQVHRKGKFSEIWVPPYRKRTL